MHPCCSICMSLVHFCTEAAGPHGILLAEAISVSRRLRIVDVCRFERRGGIGQEDMSLQFPCCELS
jgi:hypothetical protein